MKYSHSWSLRTFPTRRSTDLSPRASTRRRRFAPPIRCRPRATTRRGRVRRSEEHTSELQSLRHLVCRLLLEKKKLHEVITFLVSMQISISSLQTHKRNR